jgi:hypothetical protein
MEEKEGIAGAINLIDAVALHLIRGAFIDLAGAFARIDAVAAEAAVSAIAGGLIASVSAYRADARKQSGPDQVADGVGHLIRKTVADAKKQIEAATKPH